MVGHSVGVRRADVGIAVAGATALVALLLAGPAVGADGDAPLAEAGLDQQVLRGETVRLDATGSYDPDGRVLEYEWEIRTPGGLTVAPFEPHDARTSFPATVVGRYRVTLTVTDDDGRTGTDTMYVRVGDAATDGGSTDSDGDGRSAREGSSDGVGRAGESGTAADAAACSAGRGAVAGGCSVAPDSEPGPWVRIAGPKVVRAGHSYTYTASTGGLSGERSYAWESGDTGQRHTLAFRSPGEYTARVTVRDAKGRTATDRMEVFVAVENNERPNAEIVDPATGSWRLPTFRGELAKSSTSGSATSKSGAAVWGRDSPTKSSRASETADSPSRSPTRRRSRRSRARGTCFSYRCRPKPN
ncbi:hypothetical protein BRC93_05775 [Halobacteriales archaeon QS_5_70_15]|nr:MAG: hypothetical protein BRC93_05775 [Halobacteriales archaeon QS_5_70_15]